MQKLKQLWNWLVKPHSSLTAKEDCRGARLFLILMLIQFSLVIILLNAFNLFHLLKSGSSIWANQDAWVVLAGVVIIGIAFILVRLGFYKLGIIVYILDTAAVALLAPFVPDPRAEIGLLASATIPVLLTAMVFSYRWVIGVLVTMLVTGFTLLTLISMPLQKTVTGLALLIVVAVTGTLVLILRYHLNSIEDERVSEIRKVATKYRNLFEAVADGIFIVDLKGRFVEVNIAACNQLGYTRQELVGKSVADISGRADLDLGKLMAELKERRQLSYQTTHIRKDGIIVPVELSLTTIEHQGEIIILGVARDITQHQEEISFRENVIAHAAEGLCVCHEIPEFPYTNFTVWNFRMTEITGYTMEEINRSGWYQTVYPDLDVQTEVIKRMSEMRQGNDLKSEEWIITRKDGQKRILEISTSILETNDKKVHVLALMQDITQRKAAEEALLKSAKQYMELLDSVMEGIGLVDKNEVLTFANPAFARIFEFDTAEEIIGKSLLDFIDSESKEKFLQETAKRIQGFSSQYELSIITAKGNRREIYCSITPKWAPDGSYQGALGAVLDITEKKLSEKLQQETKHRLERAERMESLGVLAGGVAHDLNNMLSPVVGYAELLLQEIPTDSGISARLQKIIKSARDAADVIQDLLTLARRGRCEMSPLQMNDIITSYLESPTFMDLKQNHPKVVLQLSLASGLGFMSGSQVALFKVIMNLVSNACEAMPEGGILTIQTEQKRIDALIGGHRQIEAGEYILVRVKDSGIGISREDLDKIFEPYYSKKKMGRSGSGLGLSVVYGVVKDHHGYYDLFSEVGKGAEFVLYFPVCSVTQLEKQDLTSVSSGTETILVVDDSPEQRELLKDILTHLGYHVIVAENGREAVTFLSRQVVDAVILDMIMEPDFDGLDTYREILKLNPNQACVIVSGFSQTERVREMQQMGAGPYVRKPFSIDSIRKAVNQAVADKKRLKGNLPTKVAART
jgi:PAS domain S-box-containing protein